MRWGLKGEALLPPSSNNIRRRKDARLKRGQMSWITSGSELCNSVSQFLQNCSTPFSSSQSGKANDESASTGGKKQKMLCKKLLIGPLYFNQPKINPRWWIKPNCCTREVRYIKTVSHKQALKTYRTL